ncbi:general stress protein [Leptolyngbya sp. KIOST-1]|uniref:general stress protein n=1 Tax=Leptolyngbya sp. KIOST-1 TaxID=1229172 RepID=UPI0006899837|nr:general stress protein [Leptolyngbya sp. KIOST-1]
MVNTQTKTNLNQTPSKRVVGVFKRREDLESALRALNDAGVPKEKISLLAKHVENVEGAADLTNNQGNEAAEGAGIGATTGTVLGGVGGFLVGAGVLAIPGVGPVLAAGVGISEIAATLAGAGIGAATGGLVGALVGAGIPEDRAKTYEKRIKAGDYLLMVDGSVDDVHRVESILRDRHIEEMGTYDAPAATTQPGAAATTGTRVTGTTAAGSKAVGTNAAPGRTTAPKGRTGATDARDIDNDGEPEVIVVDNRTQQPRRS